MTFDLSSMAPSKVEKALRDIIGKEKDSMGTHIILPSGAIPLKSTTLFSTPSISHDDGAGDVEEKRAHFLIKGMENLTISGQIDEKGEPSTILLGENDEFPQSIKPSVLWAEECRNLTLENLEFAFEKPSCYWGKVVRKEEGRLFIEAKGDYPPVLPLYCMNRFSSSALKGRSLTIGFGIDDTMERGSEGLYVLSRKDIAEKVQVGDDLSWHLSGKTDFLVFISSSSDLRLSNIRISDASGFGMLTENIRNIKADRVVIKPHSGYQSVSRDGWKIFRCSGKVSLDRCHIEGTRMDGQNVHSNYMVVKEMDGNVVRAEMKYAPTPLRVGEDVEFLCPKLLGKGKVLSWRIISSQYRTTVQEGDKTAALAVEGKKNRFNLYEIEFDSIPKGTKEGVLLSPSSMTVDEYEVKNSTFFNIAGSGNLFRGRRAFFFNNRYENLMNGGILIGAEKDTHAEAMNPESVVVKNCVFINTGFYPRYGEKAMAGIAAAAQGFGDEALIGELRIEDCVFSNMERAVEVRNTMKCILTGNKYENVETKILSVNTKELTIRDFK